MNNTELARLIRVNEATVRRRMDSLLSSGAIILTALPNPCMFGYPIIAYMGLQVEIARIKSIAEKLCWYPQVHYVSICGGFTDIFIRGNFRSTEELGEFVTSELGKIQGILRIDTMVQLKQLKRAHGREEMRASNTDEHPMVQNAKATFDETDYRVIFELQKDARISVRRLAQIVGVSEATAYRRIKQLVSSGSIELTAVPDLAKMGYPTRCFIGLEVEQPRIDSVAKLLIPYLQVTYVGILSGPIQILTMVYAASTEHLFDFVASELGGISGIIRASMLIQMKRVKRTFNWLQPDSQRLGNSQASTTTSRIQIK